HHYFFHSSPVQQTPWRTSDTGILCYGHKQGYWYRGHTPFTFLFQHTSLLDQGKYLSQDQMSEREMVQAGPDEVPQERCHASKTQATLLSPECGLPMGHVEVVVSFLEKSSVISPHIGIFASRCT
ncbi:MAG: hypothetical protein LC657_19775, partial [Desulfobacteraceae bacterium]|nr:hypothetical protein [Desulfobacteraceae bacterium]